MSVSVDVTALSQVLIGVASIIIPVIGSLIYKEVAKYCHIGNDAATAQRVQHGVDAISDIALAYLHAAAAGGVTVSVNSVVADALKAASAGLLDAAVAQGTTPEMLASRVTGALITKAAASPPVPVATP